VDSFTWLDQLMFGMHGKIEQLGWTGMYVGGDRRVPAWGYTIGLTDRYGHPELVAVGLGDHSVAWLFEVLATRVTEGARLDELPDGRLELEGHPFRIVPVHSSHWATDRFNMWLEYYELLGERAPRHAALQVQWPDENDRLPGHPDFDPGCRRRQTRLDRPARTRRRDRPPRAA